MEELRELLEKLKTECDKVTIFIRSGGRCCRQTGCICKVTDSFVVLFNRECKKIYISFECICVISKLEEEKRDKFDEEYNCSEEETEGEEDNCYHEVEEGKENEEVIEEESPGKEEEIPKVYGYGRKIKLNFKDEASNIIVDKINIAELSIDLSGDESYGRNYIEYFHKDTVGKESIGLSLLPSGEGEVTSLTCNQEKAVVEGRAALYFNSEDQGIVDFELEITKDKAKVKIKGEEEIELETEELVGVGRQTPFIIEKD